MNTNNLEIRIAFLGDSISEVGRSPKWHGGASTAEKIWSSLAVQAFSDATSQTMRVGNFGIGGQNTYEGLGRLDVLEPFAPHLVVVAFGANDCCHHFLIPAETKLALVSMVGQIRSRFAADVVVVGTGGDNPHKPFFQHLEETLVAQEAAAQECGVPFVDIRSAMLEATRGGECWGVYHLADDNCHPNDFGHRVWSDALLKVLLQWKSEESPSFRRELLKK